jgi:hypothetical protein
MKFNFFQRGMRREPTPAVLMAPEAAYTDACVAADKACEALHAALETRRQALTALVAASRGTQARSILNRNFSVYELARSVAFHQLGGHLGLPHLTAASRRSFADAAKAVIASTDSSRWPPTDPAAGGSGQPKEAA